MPLVVETSSKPIASEEARLKFGGHARKSRLRTEDERERDQHWHGDGITQRKPELALGRLRPILNRQEASQPPKFALHSPNATKTNTRENS